MGGGRVGRVRSRVRPVSPARPEEFVQPARGSRVLLPTTILSWQLSRMPFNIRPLLAFIAFIAFAAFAGELQPQSPRVSAPAAPLPWPPVATFSILAFDPATGEIGAAVQSRVFSVGNGVLWGEAGVGAAATQAIVDVSYGPQAIALLRQGMSPEAIVKKIWTDDPDPRPQDWSKEGRQFAVIDAKGNVAAYTGPKATEWAGHKACTATDAHCTAQGNILAGSAVVRSEERRVGKEC